MQIMRLVRDFNNEEEYEWSFNFAYAYSLDDNTHFYNLHR